MEKEKSEELHHKFWAQTEDYIFGKNCALICVDEIIKALIICTNNVQHGSVYDIENVEIPYWQEVKQEIEKL